MKPQPHFLGRMLLIAVPACLAAVGGLTVQTAAAGPEQPLPRLFMGTASERGRAKIAVVTVDLRSGGKGVDKLRAVNPFGKKGRGSARVAGGNLDGDAFPDLVAGRGEGKPPQVRSFDGRRFKPLDGPLGRFSPFEREFRGGVYVARGDINRDGTPDIVVGPGPGGGPHVRVFSGKDGVQFGGFDAFAPEFQGGVRVATGDVNLDGFDDIIVGAGPGGGPHVRVFSGEDRQVLHDFFAFNREFNGGVHVAAGDVNGDGRADMVVGQGDGGSDVLVVSGLNGDEILNFSAFPEQFRGGVTVAAGDVTGDGRAEVIAGTASEGGQVKIFNGVGASEASSFFAFSANFKGGVYVAYAF